MARDEACGAAAGGIGGRASRARPAHGPSGLMQRIADDGPRPQARSCNEAIRRRANGTRPRARGHRRPARPRTGGDGAPPGRRPSSRSRSTPGLLKPALIVFALLLVALIAVSAGRVPPVRARPGPSSCRSADPAVRDHHHGPEPDRRLHRAALAGAVDLHGDRRLHLGDRHVPSSRTGTAARGSGWSWRSWSRADRDRPRRCRRCGCTARTCRSSRWRSSRSSRPVPAGPEVGIFGGSRDLPTSGRRSQTSAPAYPANTHVPAVGRGPMTNFDYYFLTLAILGDPHPGDPQHGQVALGTRVDGGPRVRDRREVLRRERLQVQDHGVHALGRVRGHRRRGCYVHTGGFISPEFPSPDPRVVQVRRDDDHRRDGDAGRADRRRGACIEIGHVLIPLVGTSVNFPELPGPDPRRARACHASSPRRAAWWASSSSVASGSAAGSLGGRRPATRR